MTRRLRESKFPIKVKDKDLYPFGKVHSLIRKCKSVIKPVYEEWWTLSSENRKRWVLEGINFPASMTKLVESAKKYGEMEQVEEQKVSGPQHAAVDV